MLLRAMQNYPSLRRSIQGQSIHSHTSSWRSVLGGDSPVPFGVPSVLEETRRGLSRYSSCPHRLQLGLRQVLQGLRTVPFMLSLTFTYAKARHHLTLRTYVVLTQANLSLKSMGVLSESVPSKDFSICLKFISNTAFLKFMSSCFKIILSLSLFIAASPFHRL